MNFFYFASLFIGFPPVPVPHKLLVLLFSSHDQFGGLEKNSESEQKIEADQGNDMAIANSCETSKRAPS